MHVVSFDTETCLLKPGLMAPPLVCVTYQHLGGVAKIVHARDAEPLIRSWLEDGDVLLVGQNVSYDFAVIAEAFPALRPAVFAAYDADRVTDTMIRAQLLDIAAGTYRGSVSKQGLRKERRYDLESLAKRYAGMELQKDAWRLSYGEFLDVSLSEWPARAREVQARAAARLAAGVEDEKEAAGLQSLVDGDPDRCTTYPLDDARATLAVYLAQESHAVPYLADQYRQARAAFALHLSSAWGLRTDAAGVAALRTAVEEELVDIDATLIEAGLLRADGTRDTKAAKRRMVEVCTQQGLPVIRTAAHLNDDAKCGGKDECEEHICLDGDACERVDDEILADYARRTTLGKQLSNDIPALEGGIELPVHTSYGLAGTGRTTSSKPNIQNQSRRAGFREAFIPRPGYVFAQCDYPGLELYTWAQCCKTWFGYSKLAEALNAGLDPHLMLAAELLHLPYEETRDLYEAEDSAAYQARDRAKPGNFGFAGGMGVPRFLTATRKGLGRKKFAELGLNEDSAKVLKETWKATWPESEAHFCRAADACHNGSLGQVESLFTGRHRGGTTYCATCNTPFQGLGADCAKRAMWLVAKAQYTEPESPLWNTRTVFFVHDELGVEVPDDERADPAARELARLMSVGANEFLPDVPIPVSRLKPLLMRRWSKKAKPCFDASGRLVPWEAL